MILNDSTVSGNTAGGAIGSGGILNNGTGSLRLTNVTVSNNTASVGIGGISNLGTAILNNTIVANNTNEGDCGSNIGGH